MCSLGIEPTTFCATDAMLYHWATQEHIIGLCTSDLSQEPRLSSTFCCSWCDEAFFLQWYDDLWGVCVCAQCRRRIVLFIQWLSIYVILCVCVRTVHLQLRFVNVLVNVCVLSVPRKHTFDDSMDKIKLWEICQNWLCECLLTKPSAKGKRWMEGWIYELMQAKMPRERLKLYSKHWSVSVRLLKQPMMWVWGRDYLFDWPMTDGGRVSHPNCLFL